MKKLTVLIMKEFVQMTRDFRMIWLPIAFMFLGATQPVVNYYLPSILEALGGGQGITIDPSLTAPEGGVVLASTLASQFDQLGIMIVVISMMGIIQTDKANGMLAFILTRPVGITSYIVGKIISHFLLAVFSVTIGYFTSYLYVNFLFSKVPFSHMIIGFVFYLMWVLFIVSFTTMISAIFKSQGVIALISIVFLISCRLVVGLNPLIDLINPASMSQHAMETLTVGLISTNVISNGLITLVWIMVTLFTTHYWIANKKFNNE
ncbi:hypothetical protein MKZ17_01770 [Solibacillus sp. FSL R7-0682]|uniref:ABC transporter permease n=1 Tax=Solibacillus sp. FSL R7-0682 TaxID=2921690 RepID=UPI0030FBEC63